MAYSKSKERKKLKACKAIGEAAVCGEVRHHSGQRSAGVSNRGGREEGDWQGVQ